MFDRLLAGRHIIVLIGINSDSVAGPVGIFDVPNTIDDPIIVSVAQPSVLDCKVVAASRNPPGLVRLNITHQVPDHGLLLIGEKFGMVENVIEQLYLVLRGGGG